MATAQFPIGITSVGLESRTRELPTGEAPPWPPNDELSLVGRAVPRLNGRDKVTGAARFTVDTVLPGMLHGAILRCPMPHARVVSIDVAAASHHPGIGGVLVLAEPGAILRYVGAPVAALAGVSVAAAQQALHLIHVQYEALPFVVDMRSARAPSAPLVHDAESAPQGHASGFPSPRGLKLEGNVRGPATEARGALAQGFAAAEMIVDGDYGTQVQTQCCLEPHAIIADWRADGLTVRMSTQFTAGVRHELAEAFDLPLEKIRVLVDAMGGGFGSKSSLGNYGRIAVMLSRQAGVPVRVQLQRHEEQLDSGNRPGTWQRLRVGALRDGTLTAIELQSYGTAGVGLGAGVGNIASALYTCPNFAAAQFDVFINAGPGCAMRGPGATPGAWGMEQAIDELAEKLGLDPVALRDRIDPSAVRREERRLGAARIGWARRHAPGADRGLVKRGLGMAQSLWGANVHLDAGCDVRVGRDGTVEVRSSVQDIGTGIGTILAQVVAETMGLPVAAITVRIGDTDYPAGGPSYGSRTTASVTPPARNAAWQVLQHILAEAAKLLNAAPEELVARDGRIVLRDDPARGVAFAEATALLGREWTSAVATRSDDHDGFRRRMGDAAMAHEDLGGVQFAEVAVDTETGMVRVERVVAVQDCGRPMNPLLIESQVQGGVLMGLSYALHEDRVFDQATGRMLNADLEHYKLAGACDAPRIEVLVLENYQGQSATDAYGIAEPANIATAPAIANAVYNAIGVRPRFLPMTPAAILDLLDKTGGRH